MAKSTAKQLVVCVNNGGYPASLDHRKIYFALRDAEAEKHSLIRVLDESGEGYLYPKSLFRPLALPLSVKKAVLAAAWSRDASAMRPHHARNARRLINFH